MKIAIQNITNWHFIQSSIFLALILFIALLGFQEYFLEILVGLVVLSLSFFAVSSVKKWLYFTLAIFPIYFIDESPGIDAKDVFFAAAINLPIYLWLLKALLIDKTKIINSFVDWSILFAFIYLIFNALLSLLNESKPELVAGQTVLFSSILYYFPLKHEFTHIDDVKKYLSIIGFLLIPLVIINFYFYYLNMLDMQYAYQMGGAVRTNIFIQTIGFLGAVAFIFFPPKRKHKIFIAIIAFICGIGLIATFARTFWAVALIGLLISFILFSNKEKLQFLTVFLLGFVFTIISVYFIFGDNANVFLTLASKKAETAGSVKKDISAKARLFEWDAALKQVEQLPLSGVGYAKDFRFYEPITQKTKVTDFIHNGYIHIYHKGGLVLLFSVFGAAIYGFIESFYYYIKVNDKFYKRLALTSMLSLLLTLAANITTNQFAFRDALIVFALSFFLLNVVRNKYRLDRKVKYANV